MADTDTTSAGTEDNATTTKRSTSPRTSSSSKRKSSSSSSSGSSKKVWDALDAVTEYITRHGDEAGIALRAKLAELKPGKTTDVAGEDNPATSGDDDA